MFSRSIHFFCVLFVVVFIGYGVFSNSAIACYFDLPCETGTLELKDNGLCGVVKQEFGYNNYETVVDLEKPAELYVMIGWVKTSNRQVSNASFYVDEKLIDQQNISGIGRQQTTMRSDIYPPGQYKLKINKFAGTDTSNDQIAFCANGQISNNDLKWNENSFQFWNDQG